MATKKKTKEELLVEGNAELHTEKQTTPEDDTSLGGAPPPGIQEQSETISEDPNESGGGAKTTDDIPRVRKRIQLPDVEMNVLQIGDELGVQTEAEKARDAMLDLVESMRTRRYLTDTIQGVEKSSSGGEPRAVLYHGDFKVIIPASLCVTLPKDLRDLTPFEVYHYLLSKRLGSEIDYVVKGIDPDTGIAVGD